MKMKKHAVASLMVIFFTFSIMNAVVLADKEKQELSGEQEQEKMIKLFKEYASPGENHKFLQYFVGQWESIQKIWPEPGSEPITRKQEINVQSLFGGRFTKAYIKTHGEVLGISIEGIVITGYDNYKKEFVSVSYGTTGTNLSFMSGTLDKNAKIRIDTGHYDDIFTGEKLKVKGVTTIIDKDRYTYEYYYFDPRKNEIKSMEITYTRKK